MTVTINPPSEVDEAAFAVRRTIRIQAPVDKVWATITEPALVSQWFGPLVLDGAGAGATGRFSWPDRDPIPMRIEAFDPPRSVTYRWCNDDARGTSPATLDELESTVFTFTLDAVDDGTRLTVVESGFENTSDPAANLEFHRQGWNSELDELVALAESA